MKFRDLTNNDMHVIEAIGIDEAKNMSTYSSSFVRYCGHAYHSHEQFGEEGICGSQAGNHRPQGSVYLFI